MAGRPKLVSVNSAITCSLCKGYLINAMTLCRCMHTFCRSCIHRYLDTSSTCPTCQQRVFRSRMDTHMLPDHTLQSIVYRVVPGLYEDEMRRRREFYENSDDRSDERTEEKGFPERVILSDKDKVSVVLAYRESQEYPKLYLELAAAMPVSVLLNFLRDKCKPLPTLVVHLMLEKKGVGTKDAPDRLVLDPDFTIFDVCYIAKYNLQGPLELSFTFVQFDPESFKDKRLLESPAMSESSILRKSLNHRYRDERINGHSGVASKAVKNVQYTKVKTDTKSIVLSKTTAVDSAVNSMKTYSRNAGSNGGNGSICQLTDGVVAGANASEGDSTEEEVDSWDSNVSTTIDSLTNSSQHSYQQQQPPSGSAGKPNKAAAAAAAAAAATVTNAGAVQSSPSPASKSSKHSKSSAGASSIHANNPALIVPRPQSLRIDAMRDKSDKPAGKQAISPVVQQSAPVGHHKRASQDKKSHHHHHHHHHKNHNASSTSTASASTVAGKPPTVLKIKLNTSPTTSETLTITSPPIRETRKTLEYPAVTSIKIKPIIAPPSPPSSSSSPSSSRETRAGSVESGGRKKRRSEDKERTIKDKSPSEEEPVAPKKTKKAKAKKNSSQNTQAVINDTAYVSDQPKDLLSTSNFGWSDSSLWESQLRIPSPLTVPLTVSVARRKANQAKNESNSLPLPPTSSSFLEENFSLKKNKVVVKPAHNRIWRKRRHVSPPPVPVKLPPPDFKMSSTLSAVMEAVKNDKSNEALSPSQCVPASSPSSSPLRDCYFSKPAADHNDFPSRRQSDTDHFLDSGVRPGSSSSGDINADVFRMEFPVAAINPPTQTVVSPKLDRSQSYTTSPTATSPQYQVSSQENVQIRRMSCSSSTASSPSSSCAEVKFSINNILSNESSPSGSSKLKQDNEPKELNIQESIETFITNISKFFWALEASKGRVGIRMSETFLAKRAALERILLLLRKLTIVVAPNQIERVLQLESAIQKYFQTDVLIGLASSKTAERIRSPLESLKPDTLKRLEQNDVQVTPVYPNISSDNSTDSRSGGAAIDAHHKNGSDSSISIVCITPVSEISAKSPKKSPRDATFLTSKAPPADEIPNLNGEAHETEDTSSCPYPESASSGCEKEADRLETSESQETPKQIVISDSGASVPPQDLENTASVPPQDLENTASIPPQDLEDTASIPPQVLENTVSVPPKDLEDTASVPPEDLEDTASSPPKDLEDTASSPKTGTCEEAKSALDALLDSVEQLIEIPLVFTEQNGSGTRTEKNEQTEAHESDDDAMQVEDASEVGTEPQSRREPSIEAGLHLPIVEVPRDTECENKKPLEDSPLEPFVDQIPAVQNPTEEMEVIPAVQNTTEETEVIPAVQNTTEETEVIPAIQNMTEETEVISAVQNTTEEMEVDQNSDTSGEPQILTTECRSDASGLQETNVKPLMEVPIASADISNDTALESVSGDSEMQVRLSVNRIETSDSLSKPTAFHEETVPVQDEDVSIRMSNEGDLGALVKLEPMSAELELAEVSITQDKDLSAENEVAATGSGSAVLEVGIPVVHTDNRVDEIGISVGISEDSVNVADMIPLGADEQTAGPCDDLTECTKDRLDSMEVDSSEVVDPHVTETNFGEIQTENNPKNRNEEHDKSTTSTTEAVYDGSFGYNSCKSVVPYVPVKRNDSYCWASDAFRSGLGKSAIHDLFPLRVPRISFVENEISTCDPAPRTHKTGLELVPYVPRSKNPIENLFRLSGLIPERVPIPSPVHDYIMEGSPKGIPNSEKQTKTHSLLDFLKLQQKSHVVQQNTSPNFGDIDMDVHRWEEVDELGSVAPPSGLVNVPGSLNVH